MLFGMPESSQILYAVRVGPTEPQPKPGDPLAGRNAKFTGPRKRYSIDFMIRWTDVKLDAQSNGTHTGKIQMELMAYDRDGNALNWTGATELIGAKA